MLCLECCLYVLSNGVVVVEAVEVSVEKVRLPTGEWRLTTRIDEDQSNSRRLYHNDNQGGGGTYLNAMCRFRLGWTVHSPGTPNYWRAHQALNVDSVYSLHAALPGSTAFREFADLRGSETPHTWRLSFTVSSDWLARLSYAQHFILLHRAHLTAQALLIFRPAGVVSGPPIVNISPF